MTFTIMLKLQPKGIVVAALALLFASGCATRIRVTRLRPAEVNLKGVRQIAVLKIEGRDGDKLESQITQGLFDSKRFDLVERNKLDQIMHELNMSTNADFSDGGAQLGKLLPATVLISGRVLDARYHENVEESRGTCSRTVGEGQNSRREEYACTTYTRRGSVQYHADLRVLDTNTGRILATRSLKDKASKTTSATNKSPESIDGNAMLDECRADVVAQFLRMVAPWTVSEVVELTTDDDLPELKAGNEYIKRNDYQKSIEFYGRAVARATASAGPFIGQAGGPTGERTGQLPLLNGFDRVPPRDDTSLHYASQWFAIAVIAAIVLIPSAMQRARKILGA